MGRSAHGWAAVTTSNETYQGLGWYPDASPTFTRAIVMQARRALSGALRHRRSPRFAALMKRGRV